MNYSFRKTNWIGSNYEIKKEGHVVGRYCENEWKQLAKATLGDKSIRLKIKDAWKPRMEIINQSDNKPLGIVRFSSFSSKATITLKNKKYVWKTRGIWGMKWNIFDGGRPIMAFNGGECSGRISDISDNQILLLTGLSIQKYVENRTMIYMVVAIFLPMIYLFS